MKNIKYFVVAFFACCLGVFIYGKHVDRESGRQSEFVREDAAGGLDDSHVDGEVRDTGKQEVGLSELINTSKSKEYALSKLLPEAELGKAEYVLAVNEVISGCSLFYLPAEYGIDRIVPAAVRSQASWQAKYAERKEYCGTRSELDLRAEAITKDLQQRMDVLANQGDKVAQMYDAMANSGGRLDDSSVQMAVDLLRQKSANGEVAKRAAHALLSSRSKMITEADGEIFGSVYSEEEKSKIRTMAAEAYACGRGVYCGPNGNFQLDNCLLTGQCNVSSPLLEYMRNHSLSGEEYRLMKAYVDKLQTIASG